MRWVRAPIIREVNSGKLTSWGIMKKQNLLVHLFTFYFVIYFVMPQSAWSQFTISSPTFPTTNTVQVSLAGTQATNAHVIFFSPQVVNGIGAWNRLTTGTVGQVTFTLPKPTNGMGFFAAGIAPISTPTVATPAFSPTGGSYSSPTNVTVTSATSGASIYYTTNGVPPTINDTYLYNGGSIYIAGITTLKAKAFASGYNDSGVATAIYTINSAPFVYAGAQQIISSSSTTLQGIVMDDGLTGAGAKFTNWMKFSGPGTVTFSNFHQTNTSATFSANGVYVLHLSVSDGQYTNTSAVTIAVNPTVSVSLTAPISGSIYTVPTNFVLEATATSSSGTVTNVSFYANSTLIGSVTNAPFSFNWKSVTAGSLALSAVAYTTDAANTGLASSPVNVTVNWPTNVGQVSLALTDLQIPVAGLPITVNRQYNTQYGTSGSFGYNGRFNAMDSFAGYNEDPQSLHKYLYTHDNPVNRIDPSGNNSDVISFNVAGAIAASLAVFTLASNQETKTHAIGNLLVATTGAAGELLDEASSAAQNAMAAAESALLSQYRSFEEAASKAREALRQLGNTLKNIKVVPVSQTVMPDVANHVSAAQSSGHPILLTRVSPAQGKLN